MKMLSRLTWIAVTACFTSCVSTKNSPLGQADAAKLRGADLATARRDVPAFAAMTASKAALGAFGPIGGAAGAAAMTSAGKNIIESNGVKDPADQISKELAAALASARGAKVTSSPAAKVPSEEPRAIAAAHSGSDYVIDVRTINWSSVYFPTNWARYRVIYSARLRLIETKTGRVVAEGFHARIPEQTDNAPTQDELLANSAAVLKRELQISAAESVAHFKKNVLGL